ncbi:MAG: hypothetical protein U0X93_00745 [Anaerolineales bacterium]
MDTCCPRPRLNRWKEQEEHILRGGGIGLGEFPLLTERQRLDGHIHADLREQIFDERGKGFFGSVLCGVG